MTPDAVSRPPVVTESAVTQISGIPGRADRETGLQPREWRILLPYPRPPLSLNQRLHWAAKAKITKQIIDDVTVLAHASSVPKGLVRVGIVLHWSAKTNRRRDTDNPAPTLKAAIDALTRYGLTADDDSTHVTSGTTIESGAPVDALWLSIFELRDGPETADA